MSDTMVPHQGAIRRRQRSSINFAFVFPPQGVTAQSYQLEACRGDRGDEVDAHTW